MKFKIKCSLGTYKIEIENSSNITFLISLKCIHIYCELWKTKHTRRLTKMVLKKRMLGIENISAGITKNIIGRY